MSGTDSLFPGLATTHFVEVVLPLAIPKTYTYAVPEHLVADATFGKRVEVQFGKSKLYTGLVVAVHQQAPDQHRTKPILSVIDEFPIIHDRQYQLWKWVADYYLSTLGEVMHAALPANLKLASETLITLSPLFDEDFEGLDHKEYLIAEALSIQTEISIEDVRGILGQKTVYPLIRRLLEKRVIYLKEDLKTKYAPKTVSCIQLQEPYRSQPESLATAFNLLEKATRQMEALVAYIQLAKSLPFIRKQDLYKAAKVDNSVLKAMVSKGIFELYDKTVSRLGAYEDETIETQELSSQQEKALQELRLHFREKQAVLLHGVTGSGKTRVYVELIQDCLAQGKQVLYLLPEIALTTQIISRLEKIFGDLIAVYHSRLSNNERVELWNAVLKGKPVLLGARSALFLPFCDLGLIIVDEEHDPSYKQHDPNPRYNARDAAMYLARIHDAKVLLGTATPSLESYFNAKNGKYGLVEMKERFGGLELPQIVIADLKEEHKQRKLQSHFSTTLTEGLKATLDKGEQAILFQNRRGYSPMYRCPTCNWHSECIHCDVSLTYHKFYDLLKCHYCGYQTKLPTECPACGTKTLHLQGFGTEKIEDELKIYLPEAKIGRMDLDTVRSKNAHAKIINDFEEGRIEVLVGTQMVTKGLDFEKVGIVGILSADQLVQFPDFRAGERAFQLMLQVSGRAGRKHQQGKVIIQAFNTAHPVIREVMDNDFLGFFQREMQERYEFRYPPYVRLIRITLKHKKPQLVEEGARLMEKWLKKQLGEWVIGPASPPVARLRNYYLVDFLIKINKNPEQINFAKKVIVESSERLQTQKKLSSIRVNIDVDPY